MMKYNFLAKILAFKPKRNFIRFRNKSTTVTKPLEKHKNIKLEDVEDAPISYMRSPASKWRASTTRSGEIGRPRLWYEPYVIIGSLSVFLVYFCILREENSVDEALQRTLYDRIEGLERHQVEVRLAYNESQGLETKDLRDKLEELKREQNEK